MRLFSLSFYFFWIRRSKAGGGIDGREIEITSNYSGTNWNDGIVTPIFNSWWLSGAFEKPVNYSYGYIARPKNTDYLENKNSAYIKKSSKEAEGELRLVERVGSFKTETSDSSSKKLIPYKYLNGLTTKKFILVGVNRASKNVEVSGLVSLVKVRHPGIKKKCHNKEEKDKAIQNGFCDDVFFKEYYSESDKPGFIETQLKNQADKQVGVLRFNIPQVKKLNVIFGGGKIDERRDSETRWSRSGVVEVEYQDKKEKLFVGPPKRSNQPYNRPYVVVHDLIFSEGKIGEKWKEAEAGTKSLIELGYEGGTDSSSRLALAGSKDSTITLDLRRQYYLWDPSFTRIRNGKLETQEGYELPWNVNIKLPFRAELIK